MDIQRIDFSKGDGLVPAIVQDAAKGTVLMQAWMNEEALQRTLESKKLCFYSRSKGRLWTKGETSGHFMRLREAHTDCDGDSLLFLVDPAGPACHTGEESCFGADPAEGQTSTPPAGSWDRDLNFLKELEVLLDGRRKSDPDSSYTARLLLAGPKRIAKKLGEEAVELILEAENEDKQRFVEEAADLLYHLEVLLLAKGLRLRDVVSELRARHGG